MPGRAGPRRFNQTSVNLLQKGEFLSPGLRSLVIPLFNLWQKNHKILLQVAKAPQHEGTAENPRGQSALPKGQPGDMSVVIAPIVC
jgi:hypothetical protein